MNILINYNIKRLLLIIAIIILMQVLFSSEVNASYDAQLNSQLENLDLNKLEGVLIGSDNSFLQKFDIYDILTKAIKGELGLTPSEITKELLKALFSEVTGLVYLMQHMIIIAVLSAIFTNISSSFTRKSVSELGFYVNYIIVVALLISSFSICADIMNGFLAMICEIMEAAIPIMFSISALSGSGVKAYVLSPVIFAATGFITVTIERYLSPIIMMAVVLQMVNYLSERDILQKMSDLIKKIIVWGLGVSAVIFMGVVSLQGISTPILNNAAVKTAKFAVTAIPVVGPALSSAVDTVIYWSDAVKSGFLVVILILLIAVCAVPLIKIAAFIFVYKLTAAVIQPICDPRIVKAIDCLGGFASLMLGVCAIVGIMFIFMSMIMLS